MEGEEGLNYQKEPKIFMILSRHMENCQIHDCVCKSYELELDYKVSRLQSKRISMRQSSMYSSESHMITKNNLKRKYPTKINYATKCQMLKAEIV